MNPPAQLDSPPVLNRRWLFAAACVGMFNFGMVIALLGTLFGLPEMRDRLGINLAQQGDLFSILSFGMLLSSLVAGPVLDRFGTRPVLVWAAALTTAALLAFALARGFAAAAAAAVLLGLGGAWLNIATNALVSDIFPDQRGRAMNLLGVFFGVGALFVPLVVAAGFHHLSVGGTMLVCAGVAAATTAMCLALRFPPPHEAGSFSFLEMIRAARYPGVLLFALLLFLQGGNESAVSGWTSTYVGSVGWSPFTATVILLGYWVVAIVGRLLSARAEARLGKARLVLVSATASVAGCVVLLAAASSLPLLAAGAWLTGLAFAAIYPTVLAIAGDRYQRFAGTVFGLLFSIGALGNISFPWAVGHISQAAGVRLGMVVPLAGAIGVSLCAWIVLRSERAVGSGQ
jgi:MFS transporter, FHS family, glucose/mannose:H+ symporter